MSDKTKPINALLVTSAVLAMLSLGCMASVVFVEFGLTAGLIASSLILAIASIVVAAVVARALRGVTSDE